MLSSTSRVTHVNHHTAIADPHGLVRVVISATDPGLPNWLDTAGHRRGALALRWVGAKEEPHTHTRVRSIQSLREDAN